ncbi:MAG: protein DpdH [Oxalobacteraceae bacterium]|nr:protein DpdH [Oxalobacteraceae bacterium]
MATLDRYWPGARYVDECIRTEAEVLDDAVLLAVHEPGPLRTRSANGAAEAPATEQDLLEALLRSADDGSAVLVAITGDSGVGKSHMVRWLHAQLQRHPKRDQLVIVLVPKTASLRQVVESMLAPLEGDAFRLLQAELAKAVEQLNPRDASLMLATSLGIELERKFETGMQALREVGADNRGARDRLDLTKNLRELIRDADVLDGWFIHVLQRIVRQTLEGGSETQTGELRRFVPDDLIVPDTWSSADAKRATINALQQLAKDDGARRPLAADILQEVLDSALRTVFRFSEALGQRTIEEIVDDIRRSLLVDGKELVLLIEDFAALAGIQQPLLNLMIAESDHGGQRIRAPLRTALAVTDGFLPSRQTILTRAKREWFIPNAGQSDDELIGRLTDLAGRYLNAARWGVTALREQFRESRGEDLYGWVRAFDEPLSAEESDMLSAFGYSRHGYPLFPLSSASIASLCRRELKSGNGLRFNPRAFINGVLRDTLLLRPLHELSSFPPPDFKGAAPTASVALELRTRAMPGEQRERLGSALVHWANNPTDLTAPPTVREGVFKAFHLPWPFAPGAKVIPTDPTVPRPAPIPEPPKPTPQPQLSYIEAWATGDIDQIKARNVRNLFEAALNDRIDWNSARMRGRRVEAGQIWLPFARTGNPSTEPKFVVAEASRPLCPVLRAGLAALERWKENDKSWDYANSENDYSIAQLLLDRVESQVLAWHGAVAERLAGAALRILHRQSLLLRLTSSAEPRVPALKDYHATLPKPLSAPDPSDTRQSAMVAAAAVRAEAARSDVQRFLADAVGCFQGTGGTLYAVDPRRIKNAWSQDLPDAMALQIKSDAGQARAAADEMLSRIDSLLTRYRSAVEPLLPAIKALIGEDGDVNIGPLLLAQIEQARIAGSFPRSVCSSADAKKAIEKLITVEAKSFMRRALSFEAPVATASVESRLAGWSSLDIEQLVQVHDALTLLDKVLQGIEREIDSKLLASGGGDIGVMVAALQQDLVQAAQGGTA